MQIQIQIHKYFGISSTDRHTLDIVPYIYPVLIPIPFTVTVTVAVTVTALLYTHMSKT